MAAVTQRRVMEEPSLDLCAGDRAAIGLDGSRLFDRSLQRLRAGLTLLPDKPEETPLSTLRALWLRAAGQHVSVQAAHGKALVALSHEQVEALHRWLDDRLAGVPLAHMTQRQRFMGLDLLVGTEALIPRCETELLGEAALALLPSDAERPTLVVDLCTGCGNIACALATYRPAARVFASDLSPEAVALAQRNVDALGLRGRVMLRQGDLLAPFDTPEFRGQIDLLVCNPPYISSGRLPSLPGEIVDHEPHLAFDGGPFGVRIMQRLIQEAPRFLKRSAWLAFEVGLGQAPAMIRRLTPALGFETVRSVADAAGAPRVILAQVAAAPPRARATGGPS